MSQDREGRKIVVEDQSRSGVKVKKTSFYGADGILDGTTVEADCGCFGYRRCHTNQHCPALKKARTDG